MQLDPKHRGELETIRNLRVTGKTGRLVPLSSVADVVMGSGPAQIDRMDRSRQVTIEASLSPDLPLGQALVLVHKLPAYQALPKSVSDTPSGDVEIQKDIFSGFAAALAAAVLLIYAVLVLLFEGYLHPFTIMMSLPLALGGALMALVIAHQSLGFYALIGIVMLMGLVTKNAILLVEYCLMAMKEGKPRYQAIVEAGEARMRPDSHDYNRYDRGYAAYRIRYRSWLRSPSAHGNMRGWWTNHLDRTYFNHCSGCLHIRRWTFKSGSRNSCPKLESIMLSSQPIPSRQNLSLVIMSQVNMLLQARAKAKL